MSSDKLANELQAGELFEAIQTNASVFGENMGKFYLWHMGSVALPDVVIERCGIETDRTNGYYGLITAPTDPLDSDMYRGINLMWSHTTERARSSDHTQYRASKDVLGSYTTEKHYLAEPTKAKVLDGKQQIAQIESEIADGLYVPDIDDDDLGFFMLAGRMARDRLEELKNKRIVGEQFARDIGATKVYEDEAEALLTLITARRAS